MSGKLDKSLDEILVNRRQGAARRRTRRSTQSKAAPAAVGGVKKTTKAVKPAGKGVQAGHPASTESKIMVSGLVSFYSPRTYDSISLMSPAFRCE
jgi:THO complex subunit 4